MADEARIPLFSYEVCHYCADTGDGMLEALKSILFKVFFRLVLVFYGKRVKHLGCTRFRPATTRNVDSHAAIFCMTPAHKISSYRFTPARYPAADGKMPSGFFVFGIVPLIFHEMFLFLT